MRKTDLPSPQSDQPSFEENLQALESVVAKLEEGSLPLGDALELYEHGIQAYKACHDMLQQADAKIAKLVETLERALKEEEFEPPQEDETS